MQLHSATTSPTQIFLLLYLHYFAATKFLQIWCTVSSTKVCCSDGHSYQPPAAFSECESCHRVKLRWCIAGNLSHSMYFTTVAATIAEHQTAQPCTIFRALAVYVLRSMRWMADAKDMLPIGLILCTLVWCIGVTMDVVSWVQYSGWIECFFLWPLSIIVPICGSSLQCYLENAESFIVKEALVTLFDHSWKMLPISSQGYYEHASQILLHCT